MKLLMGQIPKAQKVQAIHMAAVLYLQSYDLFDEAARMASISGKIETFSKTEQSNIAGIKIQGMYSRLGGLVFSLYRLESVLYFRAESLQFKLSTQIGSRLLEADGYNVFELTDGGKVIYSFRYEQIDIDPPLDIDPTPFVEEEQYDFLKFVHKVIDEPGRRDRLFR